MDHKMIATKRSNLGWMATSLLLVIGAGLLGGCSSGSTSDSVNGLTNTTGPQITAVQFIDVDANGVDEDDLLVVTFNEAVYITSALVNAFEFDVTIDTLGTNPQQFQTVAGSTRVEIELGSSPNFQTGISLINVRSSGNKTIRDLSGISARSTTTSVAVSDFTATAPTLLTAHYTDVDQDGTVNVGDTIIAAFDKPIAIPNGETVAGNFAAPVTGDAFGGGNSLTAFDDSAANRAAVITLGTTPTITVAGTFDAAVTTGGSPSGLQMSTPMITDVNGLNNVTDATAVDIETQGSKRFFNGSAGSVFLGNVDATSADVTANGFYSPNSSFHFNDMISVGGNSFTVDFLFVVDTDNNRVLIYDGKPNGNNANASVVLGQPDLNSNLPNQSEDTNPSPTSATLWQPTDAHFDSSENQLYISDTGNNRILVFDDVVDNFGMLALTNGTTADRVLGQLDFTSRDTNQGGNSPTSRTLNGPRGLHVADGQVAAADTGNNRVLIWSSIPSSSNEAASTVLGQTSFVDDMANQGGAAGATTLSSPFDVFIDSNYQVNNNTGAVLVADTGNNRVLVFETGSPATGAAADTFLGQGNGTTTAAATSAAGLDSPASVYGLSAATDRIYVADRDNNRVMVYSFDGGVGGDLTDGEAGVAIGQANDTTGTSNQGGTPSLATMSMPLGVSISESSTVTELFVCDTDNHRVLNFTTVPTANNTAANLFQGQPTVSSSQAKGHLMNQPSGVVITGSQMIVCDKLNNRVLIYNTVPTSGNPDPDVIVGQANLFDTLANQGGAAGLNTLRDPEWIATDGTRLVIADTGNHRVLIYNTIPAANDTAADTVLGQANGTTVTANSGGLSGATMDTPTAIAISGTQLFVCDRDNHRVLIFDDVTTVATGASADNVIGQADLVSNLPNRGTEVGATTLYSPGGVAVVAGRLYVADTDNNRVLGFNAIPTTNGPTPNFVLGQFNLNANIAQTSTSGLREPSGIASDGTGFLIADTGNNRVLYFDTLPITNNASAETVIGQLGLSSFNANQGNSVPSTTTLSSPRGVFFNGVDIWVADEGNSRVIRFR